jgi:hypothetical protein
MDVNCSLNGCTLIVEVWLPIDIRKGLKGCQLLMDPLGTRQLMLMLYNIKEFNICML